MDGAGPGMKRQLDDRDDFDSSKRQRSAQQASRVVFVCGLPADCLESELLALCCPFAVVEKSLMIPQKRQAFVQLPDATSAANLVTFYQTRDALIRGKKIFFEFSNRNEITQPPMQYAPRQDTPPFRADGGGGRRGIGPPNQILMVSVSKIEYDVTVDVLQQVFQKFGNVQKIVTFWKDNEFKALVQMESVDQAQAAQAALDGRDIYTGCNQLSIVFSRHPELRVRYNDDRSRDYTNPNLPPGPGRGSDGHSESDPVNPPISDRRDESRDGGYNNPPARRDDLGYRGPHTNTPGVNQGDQYVPDSPHRLFTLFCCFGDVLRIKIMFRKRDTALIQFVDDVHSTSALDHLDGVYVFGKKLRVDYSKHTSVSMPHADADRFEIENTLDFSGSPLHRYRRRSPQEAVSPCPLLHISGIPMELQRNENALAGLFAQYGFVKNFHYLQNNPKMALIEMGCMDEAIMALIRLDNMAYPDSHMRVSFSKAYQFSAGGDSRPRDRSRDRGSRNRERGPPPGGDRDRSFRDRGPPPQRGRDYQTRDNNRRPPPRY
uniref:RRM domain-containing protein n=1 Tax=Phytophthora ramorum TaxID=164328 RepID=H3HBA5_PHYRM